MSVGQWRCLSASGDVSLSVAMSARLSVTMSARRLVAMSARLSVAMCQLFGQWLRQPVSQWRCQPDCPPWLCVSPSVSGPTTDQSLMPPPLSSPVLLSGRSAASGSAMDTRRNPSGGRRCYIRDEASRPRSTYRSTAAPLIAHPSSSASAPITGYIRVHPGTSGQSVSE